MQEKTDILIENLKNKRREALDMVEAIYYTPTSPHYKDNERFSWAVKTINERYNQLENELIEKK